MNLRKEIKDLLKLCNEGHIKMFKMMYANKNLDKPIDEVVDEMDFDKLPHAYRQCKNTVDKFKLDKMNKTQRLLLKVAATFLMVKNGSTTTLEIKEELRRRFPKMKWTQNDVSQAMIDLEAELDGLTFQDTGDFRLYMMKNDAQILQDKVASFPKGSTATATAPSPVKTKPVAKTPSVSTLSRTAIVDLMKESKGKFYTVTFEKKDGSLRVMNGQTKKSNFMDNLGYINFRESNGNVRRVNPQTITEISISGNIYKVK